MSEIISSEKPTPPSESFEIKVKNMHFPILDISPLKKFGISLALNKCFYNYLYFLVLAYHYFHWRPSTCPPIHGPSQVDHMREGSHYFCKHTGKQLINHSYLTSVVVSSNPVYGNRQKSTEGLSQYHQYNHSYQTGHPKLNQ